MWKCREIGGKRGEFQEMDVSEFRGKQKVWIPGKIWYECGKLRNHSFFV